MAKRILLAVDTNTASEPVKAAGDLAELSGAEVLVLHCDELDTVFDTGIWLQDDTELRTAIGAAVGQLCPRGPQLALGQVRQRPRSCRIVQQAAARLKSGRMPSDYYVG